jgi:hypothetical protein
VKGGYDNDSGWRFCRGTANGEIKMMTLMLHEQVGQTEIWRRLLPLTFLR